MTPCRGSIKPHSFGRPPSIVSAYWIPPSVTDIRRISSGERIPNWTFLTVRRGAFESPFILAAAAFSYCRWILLVCLSSFFCFRSDETFFSSCLVRIDSPRPGEQISYKFSLNCAHFQHFSSERKSTQIFPSESTRVHLLKVTLADGGQRATRMNVW